MDLSSGSRLGPYEIVSRLGAGGMGEVWRAKDTRLDRSVAIKVLPKQLAKDDQLRLRFEREAKAISQLNHPNICTLHDVGEGYIVMELLEGETLAARIARGPMPSSDIYRYGAQIADALHRAHRAGIIHRDLKPANVMLTKSGAKLLDFGLAKPGFAQASSEAPTMVADALTDKGVILGTVQYMAPEQLEGFDTDARTDIFALGAVLYEMAAGKRAFEASTRTSTIAAIVSGQPAPISSIVPLVPPALEHVIQKCLEKEPDDRWQSAHDVGEQLRWLATSSGAIAMPAKRSRSRRWMTALVVAAAAVIGVLVGRFALQKPRPVPILRYASSSGTDWQPAASPDGKSIAFTSLREGRPRIWVKQLNGGGEIAVTEGPDASPRFSPDGSTLLFTRAQTALYRVPAVGGDARKVIDNAFDGAWSPDGRQIAFLRGELAQNLMIADATGANERTLFTATRWALMAPRFSPDGKTLAVTATAGVTTVNGAIVFIDLASGKSRAVDLSGSSTGVIWIGNDEIVYGHLHTVTGVQTASGEIVRRNVRSGREEVLLGSPTMGLNLDRLTDASLILEMPSKRSNLRAIAPGREAEDAWLTRGNCTDRQPAFSPDGEWVIFSSDRSGNLDLWARSTKSGALRRLTDDPAQDWDPQFTPDGKSILWSSDRTGHFEIWKADADGGAPRQISHDGFDAENPTQAPNGDIFYVSGNPKTRGVWRIRANGAAALFVNAAAVHPEVSPDGAYVTYHIPAGEEVVYVVRVSDGKVMKFAEHFGRSGTSIPLGRARWLAGGNTIAFVGTMDGKLGVFTQQFAFDRDTQSTRKPLAGFDRTTPTESFGIAPDGSVIVISQMEDLNTLTLVENLPLR